MGQDLLKLALEGPPKGGEKQRGGQEPKAPAPDEQSTSSDPEPRNDEEKSEQESPPPPSPERKPEPSKGEKEPSKPPKEPPRQKEPQHKPQDPRKSEHELKDTATLGNREERRVSFYSFRKAHSSSTFREGENESHALAYLRTFKTVPEHRGFFNNIQ